MGMNAGIIGGYGAVVSQGDMDDDEFEGFWGGYFHSIYHCDYYDEFFFCADSYYDSDGSTLSELMSEIKQIGEKTKDETDEALKKFVEKGGNVVRQADYYVFPCYG